MQIALQYILTLQPQWQTSILYILIASISRECKPSIPYDIYEHILYVLYCIVMGMKYSCPISNLCALGTVLCILWDLQLNTFTPPSCESIYSSNSLQRRLPLDISVS